MIKLEASSPVESYSQFYGKLIAWELPNGVIYRKFGPAIIWEDGKQVTKEKFLKWKLKNKNK